MYYVVQLENKIYRRSFFFLYFVVHLQFNSGLRVWWKIFIIRPNKRLCMFVFGCDSEHICILFLPKITYNLLLITIEKNTIDLKNICNWNKNLKMIVILNLLIIKIWFLNLVCNVNFILKFSFDFTYMAICAYMCSMYIHANQLTLVLILY